MDPERRKVMMEKVAGICIAITIASKGFEEAEHFEHYPLRVGFIFAAALFILAGSVLYERIEHRIPRFAAVFHALEGMVEIMCATLFLARGRHWIPVFLFFIGGYYLLIGLIQFFSREHDHMKALARWRPALGGGFVVFAVGVATVNAFTDREIVVFVMAGIMAVVGLLLALLKRRPRSSRLAEKLVELVERRREERTPQPRIGPNP